MGDVMKEAVKSWKFWAALGAGAVAGAVAALLYAPVEGAELRRRAGGLASNVASRVAGVAGTGLTLYGTNARHAGFQIERLFAAVSAGVEEAGRVRDEFRRKAEAARGAD